MRERRLPDFAFHAFVVSRIEEKNLTVFKRFGVGRKNRKFELAHKLFPIAFEYFVVVFSSAAEKRLSSVRFASDQKCLQETQFYIRLGLPLALIFCSVYFGAVLVFVAK